MPASRSFLLVSIWSALNFTISALLSMIMSLISMRRALAAAIFSLTASTLAFSFERWSRKSTLDSLILDSRKFTSTCV